MTESLLLAKRRVLPGCAYPSLGTAG